MTTHWFLVDKKCSICDSDKWVGTIENFTKYFMIAGTHRDSSLIIIHYKGKDYLVGIGHNGSPVCLRCFEILLGMEDFYDAFYPHLITNEDAKKRIRKLYSNDMLLKKALSFRKNGKYISNELIEKLGDDLTFPVKKEGNQ
jgi:hypothetical protein